MTTAEYLQTPETVLPRELAYGVLRAADAPSTAHQRVVGELFLALATFVREHRLGDLLFAPMDVILDADLALVVQPDLVFLSEARRHQLTDRIYGAPDLVIEVLSPDPRIGRLDERIDWFARYGVRECWLASIPERAIAVLSLAEIGVTARMVARGDEPVRTRVLEGLQLTPAGIFGW
jgi:Uma2 family endonuclease